MLDSSATARCEVEAIARKAAWRFMPIIMISYMFAFLDRIIVSFAKFPLQADLHLSDTAYGWGVALFSIGYVLFEVPSNLILYRVGARRWIMRIMISWGLVTALLSSVSSPSAFYLLRFLTGAAEAGFAPGIVYFLTLWFPALYRGRVTSLMFFASACAGLVGGPVSGLILTWMDGVLGIGGWRWLFLAAGLPCLVLGLIVLRRLDDSIAEAKWLSDSERQILAGAISGERDRIVASTTLKGAIAAPGFLVLALIYFLIQIGSYGLNFWTPHLIRLAGQTNPIVIGVIAAIPYICGALTMLVIGRQSDATGAGRAYVTYCLLAASVGFLCAATFGTHIAMLTVALAVLGAGMVASIPCFWTLPPRILTGEGAAGGIALINTIGQLGGIVSPLMVGAISDLTGNTNPALYGIAALTVLAAILVRSRLPHSMGW